MKDYFKLQLLLTNRKLKELGFDPIVGYSLVTGGFIALSIYLFDTIENAEYLYILIALALLSKLSDSKRNDFLKVSFSDKNYLLTRIIENITVSAPFLVFLLYQHFFVSPIILLVAAVILSVTRFKTNLYFTIPTPFYKHPFEYTVGFRNTFFVFPIAYFLTYIAITVNNFNLGIFAMLLIFLTSLGYYSKPENEYFVWSYKLTPNQFLKHKIKTALLFSSLLCAPVIIPLAVFHFEGIDSLCLFYSVGCAFLITIILAKYSAFPNEMNLTQGILIAFSLYFPPLLVALIPFLYKQSINRLKPLLV